MNKTAMNPYLPLEEYVPDAEPRVFEDRVYVYGSHDRAGGDFFCLEDYVAWSAPTDNLAEWKYEGVIYRKNQDPSNPDGELQLFAPDVVRGLDGRYYLYYCLKMKKEFGVAVSDRPQGPFSFYGHIKKQNGEIFDECMPYDPSVLVDTDGRIYLYYGFSSELLAAKFQTEISPGAMVVELSADMKTVITEPKCVIPWKGTAAGTSFEGHAYFEAPSMRKFNGCYYLVYSSEWCRELCYAYSEHPDWDFKYGGVIVDNGDVGMEGKENPVCMPGNNHGGLAEINNQMYIFYHRHTNANSFSRQGCAEKVQFDSDGKIKQAEITSCGLNSGPLPARGTYAASYACHLFGKDSWRYHDFRNVPPEKIPYIVAGENMPMPYICQITDGVAIGYKYFELKNCLGMTLRLKGKAQGNIKIITDGVEGEALAEYALAIETEEWSSVRIKFREPLSGVHSIYIVYQGQGSLDFLEFRWSNRPHIIIFNPDEMRADTMGHLGNTAAQTPRLDDFERNDAVSFRNAFCQNPVCVPSRCSFFTGLYPHVHGHRTMSFLLHPGETTLLKELKDAGYYVWMNDRNDLTAGQIPGWTESHATEIYYSGQKKQGPGPENADLRGKMGNKNYYSHYEGKLACNENGINYSNDNEIVEAAIERIRKRPGDQPLCMFLGLLYPHTPYRVEEPYFSSIDRNKLPDRILPQECEKKAKILKKIREYSGMDDYTEDDWKELRAVYLGMCSKIDALFGQLLDVLKDEGIYDDCAIFFLSDHGDFAGDYGLVEKAQNSFEDCLTRVPLLIKPPKDYDTDPGVSDSLVELIDFYATAMEFAGVEPAHTYFGKSLVPVAENRRTKIRDYVFCEGGRQPGENHCDEYHSCGPDGASKKTPYWPKMMAQTDDEAHAKGIMVRNERYKYVSRTLGGDEFYDLKKDPDEKKNVFGKIEYSKEIDEFRTVLLKWLQATADIVPYEEDQRFTKEMLWARVRGLVPPEREAEVRQMIEQQTSFTMLMQYCREMQKNK